MDNDEWRVVPGRFVEIRGRLDGTEIEPRNPLSDIRQVSLSRLDFVADFNCLNFAAIDVGNQRVEIGQSRRSVTTR